MELRYDYHIGLHWYSIALVHHSARSYIFLLIESLKNNLMVPDGSLVLLLVASAFYTIATFSCISKVTQMRYYVNLMDTVVWKRYKFMMVQSGNLGVSF